MIRKAIGASILLACVALQASTVKSEKFKIPFEFQVQNHTTMPAGEYQIQQAEGSDIVLLVNTKTGERLQFIRPPSAHREGKARLVFEEGEHGHVLKGIS